MLRAFKISSFEKAVFRKRSIFSVLEITKTEDADTGYRFIQEHKNPVRSFSGLSSVGATKKFCTGTNGLLKSVSNHDIEETDEVTFDDCDQLPDILPKGEESVLKIDNLKLLRDIANGDNEVYELLKAIQVKLDITSCMYGITPKVTQEDWLELLNCTISKRKSFVSHLILNTLRDIKRNYFKCPPLYDIPDADEDEDDDSSSFYDDVRCYHLFHNSLFLKMRRAAIKKMYYSKGFTAMIFSSCIVIDCSYSDVMAGFEIKELGKQLNYMTALNFKNDYPFHLMLCNFNKDDKLGKFLKKLNPIVYENDFPLTVTSKSYLDMFPKSEIVYLTPHCKTVLQRYDHNKTYIIGGYVDKTQRKPLSLAKAKEHGLEMASLPLDQFLDWGLGDKCLSLPTVLQILLEVKNSKDWHKALQVIPKRFLLKERVKKKRTDVGSFISYIYEGLE